MGLPFSVGRPWLRVAAGSSFDARMECVTRNGSSSLWRITKDGEEPFLVEFQEDAKEGTVRSVECVSNYGKKYY